MENEEIRLLEEFEEIILKNISDKRLTNAWAATQLLVSERTLYRDIKSLTGLSPNLYIRKIKMKKAKEMLESGQYSRVSEVSRKVGFHKADYFSILFKKEFGRTPSEILKESSDEITK